MNRESLKVGDIVTFKKCKITQRRKARYFSHTTGQSIRTALYTIQNCAGIFPFANGLVKKKFIVKSKDTTFSGQTRIIVSLLDNYKPGILGSGTTIEVRSEYILTKIDRIIDLNKIPIMVAHEIYNQEIRDLDSKNLYNKSNKDITGIIEESRKNTLIMPGVPKHIQWALYYVRYKRCPKCDAPLFKNDISLVDLDGIRDVEVKSSIAKTVSDSVINSPAYTSDFFNVFNMSYKCSNCGAYNIVCEFYRPYSEIDTNSIHVIFIPQTSRELKALEAARIL